MKFFKNKQTGFDKSQFSTKSGGDYNIKTPAIRLFYVALVPFISYDDGLLKLGQTYGISSPFKYPNGMSIEDACKVVSYLSDLVEKENNLEPACEQSVIMASQILEDYGFEKIDERSKGYHYHAVSQYDPFQAISANLPVCNKIQDVVDLFSVGGDFDTFKKSDLFDRYFEWYTEGITNQEVAEIYKNINKTEELGYEK